MNLTVHSLPLLLLLTAWWSFPAQAGIGPENVLLVVNSASPSSKAIANYYQQLRQIPAINVVEINWNGSVTTTKVDIFRQRILGPVLAQIAKRKLDRQIDCIAYSSDFPYAINFRSDKGEDAKLTIGSLTGMTYLSQLVLTKQPLYEGLDTNWYARPTPGSDHKKTTLGFSSDRSWSSDGTGKTSALGRRYLLSVMLGYTSGRGNSLREVKSYLRRSAIADGTHPSGTIYLMKNNNIRSKTRDRNFPRLVEDLRELGVAAEIANGVIPQGKPDVAGSVVGYAAFKWGTSGSTILPGAICEHLTSFGGALRHGASQTPLTEFLRYGAAGASGTVTEPFAIQAKFPHPDIQLHYARGCTLAESFYQAVRGPYQLLVMGDPLCRPWAEIPVVEVDGVKAGQDVNGIISFTPKVRPGTKTPIAEFRLIVDGLELTRVGDGVKLQLDTTKLADGYHELRVSAVQDSAVESRGQAIVPIRVSNHDRKISARTTVQQVPWNQQLFLTAESPGSKSILVLCNRRPVAQIDGEKGKARIDPRKLGVGPVRLQVIGITGDDDRTKNVFADPIHVEITSPQGQPELPRPLVRATSR